MTAAFRLTLWVTVVFSFASVAAPRPQFKDHPTKFVAYVDEPFRVKLRDLLSDTGTGQLVWQLFNGPPSWLTLDSASETLSGVPPATSVGNSSFSLSVKEADSDEGDITEARLTVKYRLKWTEDPLNLGAQTEGKPFSYNLKTKFYNPGAVPVAFRAVGLPSWMVMEPAGALSGTPGVSNIGKYSGVYFVAEPAGEEEIRVGAFGEVVPNPNLPPSWKQDPIPLGELLLGSPVSIDVSSNAVDPDGDSLTFSLKKGPLWLSITEHGVLKGTPDKEGDFSAVIKVSDGMAEATAGAMGTVKKPNHPPEIDPEALSFILKEREERTVNINDPKFVHDPDGDKLLFELAPVDWVSLTPQGVLVMKPLHQHIGPGHYFPIKVTEDKPEGALSTTGTLVIVVKPDPRPPFWRENPISFTARVNQAFSADVSAKADDPDKLYPLGFSLRPGGPAWLSMSLQGALSGTPLKTDIGENTWTAIVTNSAGLTAEATLKIVVRGEPHIDHVQIDASGATAEILWVINHTEYTKTLVHFLERDIVHYYDSLASAKVHHVSVYLSSNPYWFKARPILGASGNPLMLWNDADWVDDFSDRATGGWVIDDRSASAIWAMNCFYGIGAAPMQGCYGPGPGIKDVYHKGFMEPNVPMDVMIINNQIDLYGWWAKSTDKKSFAPADYAREFIRYHTTENKPFRISAIGYSSGPTGYPGDEIRTLTELTSGKFYTVNCEFDLPETLRDYAKRVIERAALGAVKRIKLTHVPIEPANIELRIASTVIPGNTGQPTDPWTYDAGKNEVVIAWEKLDPSLAQIGNTIEIKYEW